MNKFIPILLISVIFLAGCTSDNTKDNQPVIDTSDKTIDVVIPSNGPMELETKNHLVVQTQSKLLIN